MLDFIVGFLTVVEVIVALLLIGIILIQQSKSGGGLGSMGGGATETVFGASAGNVLTKATVVLAALFLGITLILAVITGHRQNRRQSVVTRVPAAVEEPVTPDAGTVGDDATTPEDIVPEDDGDDESGPETVPDAAAPVDASDAAAVAPAPAKPAETPAPAPAPVPAE